MTATVQTWGLLQSAAPVFVGVGVALVVLVLDALHLRKAAVGIAIVGLFAAAGVCLWSGLNVDSAVVEDVAVFGGAVSGLAAFTYLLGALALLGSAEWLVASESGGVAGGLVAFGGAASALLMGSSDLAVTVIALEVLALTGYALVATGGTARAYEASMKYFVQGAVVAGVMLYGLAIGFGAVGSSLAYRDLAAPFQATVVSQPATIFILFMLAAFAFKLGAAPFHSWAPDAYETAPSGIAAAVASGPKVAVLTGAGILFAGVAGAVDRSTGEWAPVWLWAAVVVAMLSIVVGNFGGLRQLRYQRMLAYSGIAQVGYAVAGFVALGSRFAEMILFGLTYTFAVVAGFLVVDAVRESQPDWNGNTPALAGLGVRRPFLAAAISVVMLSLTGIPLTVGFWGKFFLLNGIASSGWEWLAVAVIVGSVVSFGYYGGVIRSMYLEEPAAPVAMTTRRPGAATWTVLLIALAILAGGVLPLFTGPEWLFAIFSL